MKVSLNWLNDYFNQKINPEELVAKFNLMSQEVSSLKKLIDINGLVVGYVKKLTKHPDADKLSVCMVDVGDEILQIICGAPNVGENQKVIVAKSGVVLPGNFKIKKAKIRGVESNGMICSLAELGVQEFDMLEKGIYVLDDSAVIGSDPLEFLYLNDLVLDLDLTANRADLLSVRGVAYDTAALLNLELDLKEPNIIREATENPVNIYTKTKDSQVYYGQVIENIKISQSPAWLKSRLIASGIRPINNVVDITNYVMLEYGQPLHAFDYNKIESDRIIVREALEGETLVTLDGIKRELSSQDIVITDGTKPIALAGVMGGEETEVCNSTRTILLESAVFNPVKVRRTANRLNLKSESSTRFEKGVDFTKTLEALNRACELLIEYASAIVIGKPSYYNTCPTKEQDIYLSLEKLNSVTGYEFTEEIVDDILNRLNFSYKHKKSGYKVHIPNRRPMESYQDLIEEIVRIHGYDKIPLSIPLTPTQGGLNSKQKFIRNLRNLLISRGLYEVRTYSLVSEELAKKYDLNEKEVIKIMNPLTKDRECLRHSLLPSLSNVLTYNKSRRIDDVFIFEIGNTYFQEKEVEKLAILISGTIEENRWQKSHTKVDFYYLKGLLDLIMDRFFITDYSLELADQDLPNLHPGISGMIKVGNDNIGYIGKLHPQEEKNLGLKDIYVLELEIESLIKINSEMDNAYQEISKYPSIKRDIAIVISEEISAKKVIDEIKTVAKKTLVDVEIFDVYQDDSLNKEKSLAISLEFSSNTRTLEAKEVDKQIDLILSRLSEKLDARLRT
ncbi:MAG: phenylalanine--tRNA ligase subunit beta [Candidatus Izemoplasmatales bacterium]